MKHFRMKHFSLLLLLLPVVALAAPPAVTLTPSQTTGVVPFTFNLAWTVTPAAANCTASGGWTGSKNPAGGTEALTKSTAGTTSTYTLICSTAAGTTGSVMVTWIAPTKNKDGTNLTTLAGFRAYYGQTMTLNQMVQISGALATSYTFPSLAAGNWNFAMTAYNAANEESDPSNVATKTVTGTPAETGQAIASVSGTAAPNPPMPPTNVTVASISGATFSPAYKYTVSTTGAASRSTALAGLVEIGKPCHQAKLFTYRSKIYRQLVQSDVLWEPNGVVPGPQVAGPCS